MSAFQVSSEHIGAMVRFWIESNREGYARFRGNVLSHVDVPAIMETLAQECYNSVRYRYPSGPLPGPISAGDSPVPCDQPMSYYRTLTPVEAIKACHCYEYQSCEHPTWEQSEAYAICQDIIKSAIRKLPGYDDAPWGIDDNRAEQVAEEQAKRSAFHAQAVS